jgi:hypothetical protein
MTFENSASSFTLGVPAAYEWSESTSDSSLHVLVKLLWNQEGPGFRWRVRRYCITTQGILLENYGGKSGNRPTLK